MAISKHILLSIIIPFYNVEKYITDCLDSVYNQDMPEDEYEVICVNDASPDNSREIVIEYQKKHSNLILIEHEVNKKLGSARNTGRAIARGKYIWNVDSDDKIQPNVLSKIINACESNTLDVLIFNFDHLRKNIQTLNTAYPFINSEVLNGCDFIKKYCIGHFGEISPIWTQVYRKAFLDEAGIYSPPINMGEDVPFTLKSLLLANRIKSVTESCYVYRANELSLTGTNKKKPVAQKVYENCFICSRQVYSILKDIPKNELIVYNAYYEVIKYVLFQFPITLKDMSRSEIKKLRLIVRKNLLHNYWLFKFTNRKFAIFYLKFLFEC